MLNTLLSWDTVWWLMLLIYVPSCFGLIIIVLLQKGKGVGFAGAFGAGGGSEAVFGPRSSKSLPQRITYSMAGLFMLLALLMSMLSGRIGNSAAPSLVDETGMSATSSAAPVGSLGALFSDGAEEAPATPEASPETTTDAPATDATTEPASAPDAPATEAVATPAPEAEAPAADSAEAAEDAAPADAPAAQ
jgi:preprotein translocase subunit SecG